MGTVTFVTFMHETVQWLNYEIHFHKNNIILLLLSWKLYVTHSMGFQSLKGTILCMGHGLVIYAAFKMKQKSSRSEKPVFAFAKTKT